MVYELTEEDRFEEVCYYLIDFIRTSIKANTIEKQEKLGICVHYCKHNNTVKIIADSSKISSEFVKESLQKLQDVASSIIEPLLKRLDVKKIDSEKDYVINATKENLKFIEFNVSIEDLEKTFLTYECYRGYRSGNSSLLQLKEGAPIWKEDKIMVGPVLPLDSESMVFRNVGCNISEVISGQLSRLFHKHLGEDKDVSHGGHGISEYLDKFLPHMTEGGFFLVALKTAGLRIKNDDSLGDVRTLEGDAILKESKSLEGSYLAIEIDEISENLYLQISSVPPDELSKLLSLEVDTVKYLNNLSEYYNQLQYNSNGIGMFDEWIDVSARLTEFQRIPSDDVTKEEVKSAQKTIQTLVNILNSEVSNKRKNIEKGNNNNEEPPKKKMRI